MKKLLALAIAVSTMLMFSACSDIKELTVVDNGERSKFTDFYIVGSYVYIECELNVYSEHDTQAVIYAVDHEDVKTGLIQNSRLTGINKENGLEKFELKSGENTVTVMFRGDYAGVPEINRRDIPRFIVVEKA